MSMNLNKSNSQTPRRTLGLRRTSPRTATKTSPGTSTPVKRTNVLREPNTPTTSDDYTPSMSQASDAGYSNNQTKRRKILLDNVFFAPKTSNNTGNGSEISQEDIDGIIEELKAENPQLKDRLESFEKYTIEKKELQRLIKIWTNGAKEALKMIQKEVKPEQDIEQILIHLKLPTNIFDSNKNDE